MLQRIKEQAKNKYFLSLSTNVFSAGCAMLVFVLLLRSMKIEHMGYWIFFQTTLSLLDTFRSGFLQMALMKYYSGAEKSRAAEVLGSIWFLAISITLFSFILTVPALLLLSFIDDISIQIVIKWFAIIFFLTLPYTISLWRLQADQKFKQLLTLAMINQLSFLAMIILLMISDQISINNVLYAYALTCIITSSICLLTGWSGFKYVMKKTRTCMQEVYHFGKFSVGTSISANLLRSSDIFMINFLLGPALIPVYNVAQRLMEVIEIPLRSFLVAGMPDLSAAFNQKRNHDVVAIMEKYSGMLTIALIPVAILGVAFADYAVALLGGGKYLGTDAANIFRILLVLSLIYPIDRFSGVTLDIINQPKRNFYKVILMLIINVIGNYLGILWLGNLYGVALSSVLSSAVGFLYCYTSLREFLTFNIKGILNTGVRDLKLLYLKIF
ncbi:lipopolysaccharide biosynthesis protein [Pedobacter immunditicola]|uniref:lipopolysaccharide biosynthesis protein n=1 Tax=Pedobacter immunditicola TaxID=3133440 RepID=UPI0030A657B2